MSLKALNSFGLDGGVGGSNIKSIQRGTAILNNINQIQITISTVDLSKSVLVLSNRMMDGYFTLDDQKVMGYFTDDGNGYSDEINFERVSTGGRTDIVYSVIEFNNVKSLQSGVTTFGGTNLNSFDLNKTILFHSGKNSIDNSSVSVLDNYEYQAYLTQDVVNFYSADGYYTWHYFVVEFK